MNKKPAYVSGTFADDVMATVDYQARVMADGFMAYAQKENFSDSEIEAIRNMNKVGHQLAKHLPIVKRLRCDESVTALLDASRSISDEEMIGNLKHVTLPFDRLWLEIPESGGGHLGFLVEADKVNNGFSFYTCVSNHKNSGYSNITAQIKGERTWVSPDVGVKLDDNALLADMQSYHGVDKSALIDEFYEIATDLARTFVVLNSKKVASNFADAPTKKDREAAEANKRRMTLKRPPILNTTPLVIDMTRTDPRLFEPAGVKAVRDLLGITNVAQSKLITRPDGSLWLRKKDGQPWSRKEHTRRIENPVDRTGAERILTARKPLVTVETFPDRPPKLVIDKSLKPEV